MIKLLPLVRVLAVYEPLLDQPYRLASVHIYQLREIGMDERVDAVADFWDGALVRNEHAALQIVQPNKHILSYRRQFEVHLKALPVVAL